MLNLILGTAGTGKSSYIMKKLLENAENDIKSMLIIPEQFSKTAEGEVYSMLEKSQLGLVEVFSFTSLLRDVISEDGQIMPLLLDDAGKAVIARKSMQSVQKHLSAYDRQLQNVKFSFELAKVFEDFKRNGIDSESLFSVAQNAPAINGKLKDISLIYSQYSADVKNSEGDMEDMYINLSQTLPERYTDSTHIFIDGFESFTHGQYQILSRMMEKADNVYISLTAENYFDNSNGTHPLSYTATTAQKLMNLAKKADVRIAPITKLETQHRFLNKTLADIDNFLLGKKISNQQAENAYVNVFANQFEEVSYVIAKINSLVKQGYNYDDIAIVCPQIDKYEHQLQESFTLAKMPYFIDQSRIITMSAPVVVFKNILEVMAKGVNGETILPLLKTGLTDFDKETIDYLENYLYIWQDHQLDWSEKFKLPYQGLINGEKDKDIEILAQINVLVEKINQIFSQNQKGKEDSGKNILTEMYDIVASLNSEEILADVINNTEDKEKADLFVRQWEAAISCIEQLYRICGEMVMTASQMQELFMLMVSGTEIGFAPQTQDCVMISTPQRMKIDAVKIVFVLGASQDIFPAIVSEGGILSSADIQYLKENQFEISSDFTQRFAFENLYFYKTLTTAREKLFISCATRNVDSQEILSAEIEGIKDNLKLKEDILSIEDYCVTKDFFVQYLGETKGTESNKILDELNITVPSINQRNFNVENLDFINQFLGDHLIISPTASENYYKCAFGYFVKNILKVYPIEKAKISQREAGDYLHTIAQKVMEEYKEDYYKTPWQTIKNQAEKVVGEYLAENYPEQVQNTARFKSLSRDMKENALQLLAYIHSEQNASLFRPVAFEKPIAFDSDIKPITIQLSNGKKVSIIGICDRIDVMKDNGKSYIRIVDYKTGTKTFSLDDIYNGISNQLLLYMSSVLKSRDFAENSVPAAVMYQPSDTAFIFDGEGSLYTPTGMALDNAEISKAFDNECDGRYGVIKGDDKIKSMSGSEVVSDKMFHAILEYSQNKIKEMAEGVYSGDFDNLPLDLGSGKTSCDWCGYRCICQEFNRMKPKQKAQFTVKEEKEDE